MKFLRGLFRLIIGLLTVLFVGVMILTSLPAVQHWLARQASKEASAALGSEVHIESVYITIFGYAQLDHVFINDLSGQQMLYASRVSARVSLPQLLDKNVDIEHAQLYGLQAALRQEHPDSVWNYQFLIDALSGNNEQSNTPWRVTVHSLMARRGQAKVDLMYKPWLDEGFDPAHLSIEQLSFNGRAHKIEGADMDIEISRLSMTERCGLKITEAEARFIKQGNKLSLPHCVLNMPRSRISLVASMDSLGWRLRSRGMTLNPEDLMPVVHDVPSLGQLEMKLVARGDTASCHIDTLTIEHDAFHLATDANIALRPFAATTTRTTVKANVPLLMRAFKPEQSLNPVVDSLSRQFGFDGQLSYDELQAAVNGQLTSARGDMRLAAQLHDKDRMQLTLESPQFDLSPLSKKLGTLGIMLYCEGSLKKQHGQLQATASHIEFDGHDYKNVELTALLIDSLRANLVVNDPHANASLYATANLRERRVTAEANIRNLAPGLLKRSLYPDSTCYSGSVSIQAKVPTTLLHTTGRVAVRELRRNGELLSDSIVITAHKDNLQRYNLQSDFMSLSLATSDLGQLIERHADTALVARLKLWDEKPLDSLLDIKLSMLDTLRLDVDGNRDGILFNLGFYNSFRENELCAIAQGGWRKDSLWVKATVHSPLEQRINGYIEAHTERQDSTRTPTIKAFVKDVQVGYVMDIVNLDAIDLDGKATGDVKIVGIGQHPPVISGRLAVSQFTINEAAMGSADVDITFDARNRQILLDGFVSDPAAQQYTSVVGDIIPGHRPESGLLLKVNTTRLNVAFLNRYTQSIFQDMHGRATGDVVISGKSGEIDLIGDVVTDTIGMYLPVLGVGYECIGRDTVKLRPGLFDFPSIHLVDGRGGRAEVTGHIKHEHFKRMKYNFDINTHRLLGYNFHEFGDMPFYATAIATGTVSLNGNPDSLKVEINCRPEKGTELVYNSASPSGVTSAGFITYASIDSLMAASAQDYHADVSTSTAVAQANSSIDMQINFNLNITDDTQLKVLTDPKTGDGLTLHGNGNIHAQYHNKSPFTMHGAYRVERGEYNFSIQNFFHKKFDFRPGGTITFNGAPMNGDLNLQASYPVYNVSLSDLSARATFARNGVRVDCIMNLGGKCEAPRVTFDFDLPTVNEDEKQMVRSLISTDEERNMQVLYLLGIGRFYSYDYDGSQGQGNVAMKSLLSSTLSSTLNNVISNAIGSSNWSFGTSFATGDIGWSDMDVDGLVSGRLFNNRLLINGQFGYRDHTVNGTNFIGDFDLQWFLNRSGNIAVKAYSETNERYFTKSSLTTQGVGLVMKKDFNRFYEIFKRKKQ